ncbi:MAG: extracellular solute-binding protein, partial [Spirochaetales bacterium]|nr:extracellular solute-binding protein [Spirochaetales bacterium]
MKKFLLILLSMLVFAAGAFAEGGPEGATTDKPYLELTHGWFFDGGSASDNLDIKAEYIEWFSDYFDVELKVNPLNRESYMESLSLQVMAGDIEGMIELFGGPYMGDFYNDGATLDMAPLLADNANFKKLPKMMQTTYLREGVLQAIPTGWNKGLPYVRSIRKDWLDNLGLDMPETMDEFYTVIKAFTEDDPDGNGKDDTIGMTSAGVWMMADLFGAFGVPANHVMDHCITPDPHDDYRFNDGMLKPGMKALLEWMREAYSNGYIDEEI